MKKVLVIARCCRAGLGWLLLALAALCATAATPKRVLMVDSFGRDVAPFNIAASAFRTTLARDLGQAVDIYEAPLDMARFADPDLEKPLVDFLEQRFAGAPVDLVVPIGAPAVRFAAKHRKRIFAGAPILFVGAEPRTMPPNALETNATLVTQKVYLPGFIEDILRLQPATTNIVVVVGISPLEKFWASECRREWQTFTNRLGFSWLDTLPLQQVQERVRKLPPRSFIVIPMLLMDANRVPYDGHEALEAIHAVANAPIFAYYRSQLGRGAIGGRLYQDSAVGTQAAKVAIRILRGERAADIPPQIIGASPPTYDWRELTRWGVSPGRLPAGSVIEFRKPTFWEQYRWYIVGIVVFCCLQSALIISLIVNRVRRHEEHAVATLIAELSSRFINLPADKIDPEIAAAQRRICECLGLDISLLWQWSSDHPDDLVLTHVCRLVEGPPIPGRMSAQEHFPWCLQNMKAKRRVALSSLEDVPAGATRDLEMFKHFGIKANLTIPLAAGQGPTLGAASFDTVRAERAWPEEVVERLQVVAQIFANALARKRSSEALTQSEEQYRLLFEQMHSGVIVLEVILDQAGNAVDHRLLQANAEFEAQTGLKRSEQLGKTSAELSFQWPEEVRQRYYRVALRGEPFHWERFNESLKRFYDVRVFSPRRGQFAVLFHDISERKQAEESLQDFSARFIRAQEHERSRLARELHDDITQRLARLTIDVGQCERRAPTAPPVETLRAVREGLVQLSEDVHALSYRLHPSILEDLGLAEALKAEAGRFEQQNAHPIEVNMRDIPESVSPDAALCLFRIAQEALRNAARHASARQISLSLRGLDGGLQLSIQDDGCGFDATAKRDRPSLGLVGMRERVHLVGGEIDIESAPGRGTNVLAWVPLEGRKA